MTDRSMHKFLADPDKKRHDFGARTTAKRNDAYRSSGMPFKVIDNVAEIVQLVQARDADFDLDSLWAAGGLFRQALQGKTNKSHFTREFASMVKQRIVALGQGRWC
ncbi:uncharacterized protein FTOL_13277 [Fusarium torulosum]|uniref:Uncharacterized protein n=1 Tax=Fusarium torulosum TaxID=33205 RepID=A0AAE8SPN8_9HYPO|nr:uncharacterized protein FTOL_13277 [Fusarium torulosum]